MAAKLAMLFVTYRYEKSSRKDGPTTGFANLLYDGLPSGFQARRLVEEAQRIIANRQAGQQVGSSRTEDIRASRTYIAPQRRAWKPVVR